MVKRPMKKYQFARPYQSYEFMDIPDSFSVRCPDGTSIEMNIDPEFISSGGSTCSYMGENPFIWVSIDYGLGGSRYFESEEPQSMSADISVWCERRTTPDFRTYEKEAIKRANLRDNPTFEEVISKTEELIAQIWDYAQDYAKIEQSAKKSKKVKKMAKNETIRKMNNLGQVFSALDWLDGEEKDKFENAIGMSIEELHSKIFPHTNDEIDDDDDDYIASAKKSMNKSKYSDIHKRLAKLGGFTKDDEDEDDHDGKVEVEVEVENEGDDDESPKTVTDEIEEACKDVKSVKGMRTSKKRMKMRKEDEDDEPNPLDEEKNILGEDVDPDEDYTRDWADFSRKKSRKTKKAEDMPADADDFKEDNQKGSGNAGSDMPEDADDNQDENDAGTGNAGSELPEDANDQQDIKESARKARLARMRRSARKSVNRPPVKKFSVTNGGQPNQESYNQRYSQAPMVREAIDGHMSSRANKSFDEVAMMNERIEALTKSKRNPSGNNGVPKRIR